VRPDSRVLEIDASELYKGQMPSCHITALSNTLRDRDCVQYGIKSEHCSAKSPTSSCLANMKQFTGKVHHIRKAFLDAVNKEVHERPLAILRFCVSQLCQYTHTTFSSVILLILILITINNSYGANTATPNVARVH